MPSQWRLRIMRDMLKKVQSQGPEDREGMTSVEVWVIVGALAVFASIYTYIVVGAITSTPLSMAI